MFCELSTKRLFKKSLWSLAQTWVKSCNTRFDWMVDGGPRRLEMRGECTAWHNLECKSSVADSASGRVPVMWCLLSNSSTGNSHFLPLVTITDTVALHVYAYNKAKLVEMTIKWSLGQWLVSDTAPVKKQFNRSLNNSDNIHVTCG